MALFDYKCESCGEVLERDFPVGKAPQTIKCSCGESAGRFYGSVSFVLKGSGWPSQTHRRKAEGLAANEAAGRRMRKSHSSPKLIDQR